MMFVYIKVHKDGQGYYPGALLPPQIVDIPCNQSERFFASSDHMIPEFWFCLIGGVVLKSCWPCWNRWGVCLLIPHLPVPFIFGTRCLVTYLIYWQLEDEGIGSWHCLDICYCIWPMFPLIVGLFAQSCKKCNELAHDGIKQHWSLILHSFLYVCEASTKEQGLAGNTIVWGLQSWTHDVPICQERPGVKHSQGIKGFFHVLAKLLEAIHSKDLFSNILHLHTSCMKFFPKSRRRKTQNTPHTGFKAKSNFHRHQACASICPSNSPHLLVWRLRDCSWNKGPPSYFQAWTKNYLRCYPPVNMAMKNNGPSLPV